MEISDNCRFCKTLVMPTRIGSISGSNEPSCGQRTGKKEFRAEAQGHSSTSPLSLREAPRRSNLIEHTQRRNEIAALPSVARKDKKAGMPKSDNIEAKGDFSNISHAPKAPNPTLAAKQLVLWP